MNEESGNTETTDLAPGPILGGIRLPLMGSAGQMRWFGLLPELLVTAILISTTISTAAADSNRLGLPQVPEGLHENAAAVKLGRLLFFDPRLSVDGDVSCATCHDPRQGFTQTDRATPIGRNGMPLRRNAPGLWNVYYLQDLFHDGRASSLEDQARLPLTDAVEMGNQSVALVAMRLNATPTYPALFHQAFGNRASADRIALALAAYQRTLVAGNSSFDQWLYGGQEMALSETAKRGYLLFRGKAECSACHLIDADQASFVDNRFHNTGIGADNDQTGKLADRGREEITAKLWDRGRFKTPTLRNVSLTAPYMHDGSIGSLEGVVAFYNRGGQADPNLDPLIHPLGLEPGEISDLVAFLESLTSSISSAGTPQP